MLVNKCQLWLADLYTRGQRGQYSTWQEYIKSQRHFASLLILAPIYHIFMFIMKKLSNAAFHIQEFRMLIYLNLVDVNL